MVKIKKGIELRSRTEKIWIWIAFAIFLIYAITLIFPFFWLVLNSFKGQQEFSANLWGIPNTWQFHNYVNAFNVKIKGFNLSAMFANSIIITLVGTFLSVLVSTMASYIVSKYRFRGRKLIYMIAITIMLVPTVGSMSATYQFLQTTRLFNTYLGLFLMYSGGFGFSFVLLYGYFQSVSWSYAEAAFVDGAGDFGVFIKIMIPQAAPALISLAIIQAIGLWNDYFTPYMYLPQFPTLAVGLNSMVEGIQAQGDWPTLFAVMVVSIIPIITVFAIFQRTIMENTVAGGLKG